MWAEYALAGLHAKVQRELQNLSNEQLELRSPMWEPEPLDGMVPGCIALNPHLREHANQLEKDLA